MGLKIIEIEVSKATHCDKSCFSIKYNNDERLPNQETKLIAVAENIRAYMKMKGSGIKFKISCTPEFEIEINSGKNPTHYEELSPEEEKELFIALQYL